MPEVSVDVVSEYTHLKKRSMDGAAATAAAQAVKFGLQFISQIWLARLIAPAEYGLIAMVSPILGFIGVISDLGIGTALVQQREISQSQVSGLFWMNAALCTAVSVLLMGIAPLVGLLYHEPKAVPVTVALAALFFIGSLGIYPSALLAREMRFVVRAFIDCIQATIGLIVGIVAARAGYGYWSLIMMQAATTISGLILTWIIAGWRPSRPRWDPSVKSILRFGTSLTLSNVATYLSSTLDNVIVGVFDGTVALGLYDKSYRLVLQPLGQLAAPIGRVAIPLLSRLQDNAAQYASSFRKMIQLPLLCCMPGLLCGIFLAPQLVHIFLGPKWSAIAPVFSWICVGGIGSHLYSSSFWLFSSQGRGRDQMIWSVITSAINIVSFGIGIRWGAVGVASVSGVSFVLIQTPIMLWAATKVGPVSGRDIMLATGPLGLAFAVSAPVMYAYARFVHLSPVLELAGGVALSLTLYTATLCATSGGRQALSGALLLVKSYSTRLMPGTGEVAPTVQ